MQPQRLTWVCAAHEREQTYKAPCARHRALRAYHGHVFHTRATRPELHCRRRPSAVATEPGSHYFNATCRLNLNSAVETLKIPVRAALQGKTRRIVSAERFASTRTCSWARQLTHIHKEFTAALQVASRTSSFFKHMRRGCAHMLCREHTVRGPCRGQQRRAGARGL